MTPERAEYHRLLLLVGLSEEYEKELDMVLETEYPIPMPELELALYMSDLDKTVSILRNYVLDHRIDEQQVFNAIMARLRKQYLSKELTAVQICKIFDKLERICQYRMPWMDLELYVYDYDLMTDGFISQKAFEKAFISRFLHNKYPDIWALNDQLKENPICSKAK